MSRPSALAGLPDLVHVPFVKDTLANGLDVIVHEDRDCPIVAVNVWYHVGSKNERPGRTGFAHLVEHLMFEGSAHSDRSYFQPLYEVGATLNGSTNPDRTNYWEVVPSNAVEVALWLESDRMGFLLPALTPAKFETQRAVVLNERRQNYENRPYGRAMMALVGALFPRQHPYHWLTIGSTEDLRAASFDELRGFFQAYYHPANASLALAGDIERGRALDLVRRYFEDIPPGPRPSLVTVPGDELAGGEVRLRLEDRVELPRLYLGWRTPRLFADGDAALDLVADILANGKMSRLHRRLVYETRLAMDVGAGQNSREVDGFFHVMATAAPGRRLDELEREISQSIEELAASGPRPDELERSQVQVQANFVYRLQTVGGFGGKSDQLNAYNVFLGDPGYFSRDLARYHAADVETLRRAVATFLSRERRVTLSVVPVGQPALAVPDSEGVTVS